MRLLSPYTSLILVGIVPFIWPQTARLGAQTVSNEVTPQANLQALTAPPPVPDEGFTFEAPFAGTEERSLLVAVASKRLAGSRTLKVGLSTEGKTIQLWTAGQLGVTDPTQPGRRLLLTPGTSRFDVGPAVEVKDGNGATARTWRGTLLITDAAGKQSTGWGALNIFVARGPARLTSNGKDARWGRPYRGHFEVWPQRSPEPNHRKGPLTVINRVPLEEYLLGVVPWEMSPSAPLEALKAQAICARTKTLQYFESKKFASGGFDVCDYDACQGYPGMENEKPSTSLAVEQTAGLALYSADKPIDAVYCTNSGGITANAHDVWRQSRPVTYLRSVKDFTPGSPLAQLVSRNMTEADWMKYCEEAWVSFARPDNRAKQALADRRAKSPFAAQLFGPDDWPEFYRWRRSVTLEQLTVAAGAQGFRATGFQVLERTESGRIRKLAIRGVPQELLPVAPVVSDPVESGVEEKVAKPLGGPVHSKRPVRPRGGPASSAPAPTNTPTNGAPGSARGEFVAGEKIILQVEGDSAIRSLFSKRLGSTTALPSSLFAVRPEIADSGKLQGFTLVGAGWGHGVGMCQRGAQNRALAGWDARRILSWYYNNVKIVQTMP